MNDSEVILGLLKSLCGEVAELRMAVEERNAKKKNYTFDEAREYLRISRTTMHERMRRGEFPWAVKRGKSWLFPFDKLKNMRAIRFNVCNAHISVYNHLYRSCEVPGLLIEY